MEDNKLIAEFIGMTETNFGWVDVQRHILNDDCITPLFFHTSWDWLMPVISQCRDESNSEDSHWEVIYYSLEGCDIHITYNAVVEFIKFYNQNK